MSTDSERLELAAKAAGLGDDVDTEGGGVWIKPDGFWRLWNPITDDGDRYRLAKTLDIRLHFGPQYVTYVANGIADTVRWPEDEADDAHAVLRAAAEIGRSMK